MNKRQQQQLLNAYMVQPEERWLFTAASGLTALALVGLWLWACGPTIDFRIGDRPERELVTGLLMLPGGLIGYPIARYLRNARDARLRKWWATHA